MADGCAIRPAPFRALIVDDERLALANLRALLSRDPAVEIVAESLSGEQAVADIREHRPDLLFLDVQMPECDGFAVLERLAEAAPPGLVFVTAYDQYALQAFDAAAVDYLLKPFERERFERALQRAKERVTQRRAQPAVAMTPWIVRSGNETLFVSPADVDWIEAADYYACLRIDGRRHMVRRSLADLAATLDASLFCRIHRSVIVNLSRVTRISNDAEGGSAVILRDGTSLPVSRRYWRDLRARMGRLRNPPMPVGAS
jgi:two-component system LytT family response regulator